MKNRILLRLAENIEKTENVEKTKREEKEDKQEEKENKPKGNYYYNAHQMVDKNKRLFDEGKQDKCRFFEFKGYKIFNPFKDEKGQKEVDPKEYYGDAYINSEFNKVN